MGGGAFHRTDMASGCEHALAEPSEGSRRIVAAWALKPGERPRAERKSWGVAITLAAPATLRLGGIATLHRMRPPIVYVDESGNSGQNLLDLQQPVFVIAAVRLDEAESLRLATGLAGGAAESHYTRLRKRPAGQRRVLEFLADPAMNAMTTARVSVIHKEYMIIAKLVDLLIEPVVYASGGDLYADGWHLKITQMFASLGREACVATWSSLLEAVVELVWRGTAPAADGLVRAVAAAVDEAGEHPVGEFLALVPLDAGLLLSWHGRADGEQSRDALDPALAAMYEQALWWSDRLGPFRLIYDQSKLVGRWRDRLLDLVDPEIAAAHAITPSNQPRPLKLVGLEPAVSHDEPAIQVADALAGACGELLRNFAAGRSESSWVDQLREARVLRFVDHLLCPPDQRLLDEYHEQGVALDD